MAEAKRTDTPTSDSMTMAQAITAGITQGMKELAATLKPQGPLEQAGLSSERIEQITKPPSPQRYRDIPWQSEDTGATGIAHVVESKKFASGRIVSISDYRHPPDAYKHESEGGRVPDGFHMWKDHQRSVPEGEEPQHGDLNQGFLQWRYDTYYKADLQRYAGKELKAGCCRADGEGLKTPWKESRVGAVSEA